MSNKQIASCAHPPARYWSGTWVCFDENGTPYDRMWVGCCDCGKLLVDFPADRKRHTIHPDILKQLIEEDYPFVMK